MSQDQPGDHLSIRISNADRERVAQILHNAMAEGRIDLSELEERLDAVYAAKTFADLEPVTRDLPVQSTSPVPQPPRMPAPAAPVQQGGRIVPGATAGPSNSIAVMSGVERRGDWIVPPHHSAVAVMGGVEINLTYARFTAPETVIQCFAFWGAVEIYVPDDIHVVVDGIGFMGAFEDKSMGVQAPGRPIVRITGFAMMGAVEVKPPKKKHLRADDDHRGQIED
ncbi:DUF1707 domain-containing protein [Kibdelosporangium persicum]|uniref:Cell wall-active antibiotic response 4TMS protein YvqF n=1 Tax=Kibdelosporangium persicum TaxID=2698649 RepID=A0ABX2F0F0_9PSEU|nr:DUF1707 domain-containing protein [Kibdelosporangium persicum]NRN64698.1 Cell wall-active antibiotic response 4TMS protein YvqF [Kibdelosporangium persicum]